MKLTTGYKKPIASSGTDALELTSNNSYLLLAGGGHKALSELVSPADLTTELSNYVTIGSNQTITGVKTFSLAINADIKGNADTVDGLHSSAFKKTWIAHAGRENVGWVTIAKWTINAPNYFSPYPFMLSIYREYNSPSTESYTFSITFGWNTANIVQVNGNEGTRIIEKLRIARCSDNLTYRLEMYVNPNYSANINLCMCVAYGNYGNNFGFNTVCELSSDVTSTLAEITTAPNYIVGNLSGNADTATKLTSSAGSATLPIYFSDGAPVACTASSVFSNLSNSGNDLSVTVAGLNRTLTVAYAELAGNAGTLGGYHISAIATKNDVGNGALHIKVNGTELTPEGGIFTANKGSNSTINIPVPTAESIEQSTLNKLGDKVVFKDTFASELALEMAEVLSGKNPNKGLVFNFTNPTSPDKIECNPDILSVNYIKVGDLYRLNISGSFVLNGFNFYEQKIQDNYNPVLYSVISGTINNVELSAKKTGMLYFRLSDQQVSSNGAYGPVMFELSVFVESLSTDYNEGIYGELNITQFYS